MRRPLSRHPGHASRHRYAPQAGFTIVELLIATMVFSLVLILITLGVISFTNDFRKGVNQSNVQSTTRTVLESVAQAIQFSGGDVTPRIATNPATPAGKTVSSGTSEGFCIGDQRYSFLAGWELEDTGANASLNQAGHALMVDQQGGNCSGMSAQNLRGAPGGLKGTELLTPGMRVSKLAIQKIGSGQLYRVTVRIVYGDNDLLFSPSKNALGPAAPDAACQPSISGSQYCGQSELSTVVEKRIVQSP